MDWKRPRGKTDVRKNTNAFINRELDSVLYFPRGMKDLLPQLLGVLPADNLKLSDPFGDSFMEREPLPKQYAPSQGGCIFFLHGVGGISEGSGHPQTALVH